jgi:uncharacterized protein YbjT (DUF2867 family)
VVDAYARANPDGYVVYVSGMGADPDSPLMPLRVKGLAERALSTSGIAYTCLRPGVVRPLAGIRSPHRWRRALYAVGAPALALAGRLLPRVLTTTRAIGGCMLHLVRMAEPRPRVLENMQITHLSV